MFGLRGIASIAAGLAILLAVASAPPVRAEYCRPVMPDHAEDVAGQTFRAVVPAIRVRGIDTYVTLAVTHVYASHVGDGLRTGGTVEVYSNPCDGFALVGLEVGHELLVSTSDLSLADGPRTWSTAVWRVDGSSIRLLVLSEPGYGQVWFTDDRRIAAATTVADALALVAPEATELPSTATEPGADPGQMVLLLAAGVATLALARRRAPTPQ